MPHENPPLTDDEVCRKFGITRDHPHFATARGLSDNRPDRTICDLPVVDCPHCGQGFQWEEYWRVEQGDTTECPHCERTIYVEFADITINVTLSTHPEE